MLSRRFIETFARLGIRPSVTGRFSVLCVACANLQSSLFVRTCSNRLAEYEDIEGLTFADEKATSRRGQQIFVDQETASEIKATSAEKRRFMHPYSSLSTVISVLDGKIDRQDALDLTLLCASLKWLCRPDKKVLIHYVEGWLSLFHDCILAQFPADEVGFEQKAQEQIRDFIDIFDCLGHLCFHSNGRARRFIAYKDLHALQLIATKILNLLTPSQIASIVETFRRMICLEDVRFVWSFFSPIFVSKLLNQLQERQKRLEQSPLECTREEVLAFHQSCLRIANVLTRIGVYLDDTQVLFFKNSINVVLTAHANPDITITDKRCNDNITSKSTVELSPSSSTVDGDCHDEKQSSADFGELPKMNELTASHPDMEKEVGIGLLKSHIAAAYLLALWRVESSSQAKNLWSDWFTGATKLLELYTKYNQEFSSQNSTGKSHEPFMEWKDRRVQTSNRQRTQRLCSVVLFACSETQNLALFDLVRQHWVEAVQSFAAQATYRGYLQIMNEIEATEHLFRILSMKEGSDEVKYDSKKTGRSLFTINSFMVRVSPELIDEQLRLQLTDRSKRWKRQLATSWDQEESGNGLSMQGPYIRNRNNERQRSENNFDNSFKYVR